MSYFTNFPRITIRRPEANSQVLVSRTVPNILTAVQFKDLPVQDMPYINYRIKDHERPDLLSHRVYGDSRFAWLILFFNQRTMSDWPLNESDLYDYLARIYGSVTAAQATVWSYHRADGYEVNLETYEDLPDGKYTRSAYDVAYDQNEQLREIRLISPEFIVTIDTHIQSLLLQPSRS